MHFRRWPKCYEQHDIVLFVKNTFLFLIIRVQKGFFSFVHIFSYGCFVLTREVHAVRTSVSSAVVSLSSDPGWLLGVEAHGQGRSDVWGGGQDISYRNIINLIINFKYTSVIHIMYGYGYWIKYCPRLRAKNQSRPLA